ncbi:hypothetical protein ACQJBY_044710 [Aegilops geniculata]
MEGAPRAVPPRRGGVTLAEQLAASSNLRDLLKLRDDDVQGDGEGARPARRRTLLDVIRGPEDDAAPPPAPPSSTRAAEPAVTVAGAVPGAASPGQGEERRVSLMALLEQAERQWTTAAARAGAWTRVDQDAAAEEEGEAGSGRGVGGRCCVCMARRKGAAFVPCGHTFCRACAREVRAGRGRCPLCNAAIREVLNLF